MQKVIETQEGLRIVGTTIDENGDLVVTYEPKMTARQFIESCFDGCQIKHDKDNDSLVYEKDGKWYFGLQKYDDGWYLWCSYYRVWSILANQYRMEYTDIQVLIQDVVKDTYNMGSVTPGWDYD